MVLFGTALVAALLAAPVDVTPVKVRHVPAARIDLDIGAPGTLDPDRIVCRRGIVLGSRRERKICMTAMEWQQRQDAAQRSMDTTLYGLGIAKPPPSANPH
ncbi:MAG TPA: hypothetical protein VEA44_04980 [Caulobacter sp.]|nr:hypothetical protein [Caulobacter sp.]